MLCQKCATNQAVYHSTININGIINESHLCANCAYFEKKIKNSFGLGDFLVNDDTQAYNSNSVNDFVCENCGTSYSEFLKTSFLGCPNCYTVFRSKLDGVVKSVQPSLIHVGKKKIYEDNVADDYEKKLKNLEFRLRQAVVAENYELASQLKKEINTMKESV